MVLITEDPGELIVYIFQKCFEVMQLEFTVFGYKISYFQAFLWFIVMYALLKLFFRLFE